MATAESIIDQINKIVEGAAEDFNKKLPGVNDRVWQEVQGLLKALETKGDKIIPSISNLRLVGNIGRKLLKIIVNKDYKDDVKSFLKAFNEIATLQNQYFGLLEDKFKPTALLQAIREDAISSTLEGLTDAGIKDAIGAIKQTLRQNITTGGSYKELMKTMSGAISNEGPSGGVIDSKIKTYTTTSIAQYSRNYNQTIAEGLQFEWYQYVGSTITTTRCFCQAMVKKRYFHKSEIPDLIQGRFDEFKDTECEINRKTGLPDGMISGTNVSNFATYAGGWNCQHSIFPVPSRQVPKKLLERFP